MLLKSGNKNLIGFMAVAAALSYSLIPSELGKMKYLSLPKEKEKTLYLTFDDGPTPTYTRKILDLLKAYDIHGSFFVVAESAKKNPDLIERMQKEGHLIGLHSLEHKSAMVQTPFYTNMEFKQSIAMMKGLKVDVKHYRPPWGHVNLFTLHNIKKYGLEKVMWNVMAEDWDKDTTADEIQYKLLKRTGNGDVICLHDGRGENHAPKRTIEALEKTIPIWLEDGYQFKRIDEKAHNE